MKIQDFFPFDSAVVGMENLYSKVGENSYFVQSGCIISKDKILTRGKKYLVFDIPNKTGITITEVILIDIFYFESCIHLIVEDFNAYRLSIASFPVECPENDCTMFLVDLTYFIDQMDDRTIKDYCGCTNNKKKQVGKDKTKAAEDLIEFEF